MKNRIHSIKQIALFTLLFVAALVFIKSFISERYLKELETSFSEIYEDRLMTESYIYKLSAVLYKKKILFLTAHHTNIEHNKESLAYDKELDTLISDYAFTKLTKAEQRLFSLFKSKIDLLKQVELSNHPADNFKAASVGIKRCDEAILLLQALSSIQLEEGKLLSDDSKKILSASLMSIQLEWLAYLILLIAIFSLLNKRKNNVQQSHNHQLN